MSQVHPDSGVSRRDVLCAGGAAMSSYLVMGLLGGAKPAPAQALSGPVPEVDRLALRVVTDSYQLAIAPNMKEDQMVDLRLHGADALVEVTGAGAAGPKGDTLGLGASGHASDGKRVFLNIHSDVQRARLWPG